MVGRDEEGSGEDVWAAESGARKGEGVEWRALDGRKPSPQPSEEEGWDSDGLEGNEEEADNLGGGGRGGEGRDEGSREGGGGGESVMVEEGGGGEVGKLWDEGRSAAQQWPT